MSKTLLLLAYCLVLLFSPLSVSSVFACDENYELPGIISRDQPRELTIPGVEPGVQYYLQYGSPTRGYENQTQDSPKTATGDTITFSLEGVPIQTTFNFQLVFNNSNGEEDNCVLSGSVLIEYKEEEEPQVTEPKYVINGNGECVELESGEPGEYASLEDCEQGIADIKAREEALVVSKAPTPLPPRPPCMIGEQLYEREYKKDDEGNEVLDSNGNRILLIKKEDNQPVGLAGGPKVVTAPLLMDKCVQLNTGIGFIRLNPEELITSFFQVLLSLSGGIALLLVMRSGYQVLTSQGDPEKLKEARERLTSAIVGLLFLIFSLVILEVIGVDILRIPGFS